MTDDSLIQWLEELGPETVRLRLANGKIGGEDSDRIIAWLAEKDQSSKRETKSIAHKANAIAIAALTIATVAAIAAIISAIPVVCTWLK